MNTWEFLDLYIFKDLKNVNDGFDTEDVIYFSQEDFEVILSRVERYGLGIYGIECWRDGEFYDVSVYENKTNDPGDSSWYRKAFEQFVESNRGMQYNASFFVPEELLKGYNL